MNNPALQHPRLQHPAYRNLRDALSVLAAVAMLALVFALEMSR
ncbi:hypothetical protein [Thiohalocapsa sp.]|jgi:hypothetical protein|nr:hypothetical protein [Thiohalocapsa sp.]